MEYILRQAILSDIPRLQEIRATVRENILSDPSKVTIEGYRWFIDHGPTWVYERDRKILGFAAGDPRDGSIWALFVDPAFERQGIGQVVFTAACQSLRDEGHAQAKLCTAADSRAAAFYRAAGWQGGEPDEKGDIVFTKSLIDQSPHFSIDRSNAPSL